jgi:ethanolamine utilization protein EutN
MQRARVVGQAVATAKHRSLAGWKLLVVQPLGVENRPDEFPLLAVDALGAGVGSTVILTSDGRSARELIGSPNTPVRYTTIGIEDGEGRG